MTNSYFNKWNNHFMKEALLISEMSKDPSTKVGACIAKNKRIISKGYNGFPTGIDDFTNRLEEKKFKYALTIHAELNAVLLAQKKIKGAHLYTTHYPCCDCAKVLVQVGIKKIFYNKKIDSPAWNETYKYSEILFKEAGIFVKQVEVV